MNQQRVVSDGIFLGGGVGVRQTDPRHMWDN